MTTFCCFIQELSKSASLRLRSVLVSSFKMLKPHATKGCIPPNSETEQSVSWTAPPFANIHSKQRLICKKIKNASVNELITDTVVE